MSPQGDEKRSFLNAIRSLGPVPQVFGPLKEWLMLEVHKMMLQGATFSCVSNCFYFLL